MIYLSYLYNSLETDIDFCQNGLDVLAALLSFIRDAAFNQGARLVSGDLARNEDLRTGDDSLGL
jgi:hypothetical protein